MPPTGLSKDLLGRMIAARLQERAVGGLDRDSLRFLKNLARHERPLRRQLKPGTVLVREYQGRRHTVTTVRDGFEWQGTTYPSLSAIARALNVVQRVLTAAGVSPAASVSTAWLGISDSNWRIRPRAT